MRSRKQPMLINKRCDFCPSSLRCLSTLHFPVASPAMVWFRSTSPPSPIQIPLGLEIDRYHPEQHRLGQGSLPHARTSIQVHPRMPMGFSSFLGCAVIGKIQNRIFVAPEPPPLHQLSQPFLPPCFDQTFLGKALLACQPKPNQPILQPL